MKLRAPVVPLINCTPNFNIWCNDNRLNESITRHWSGLPHPMTGILSVNNKEYLFMGNVDLPRMEQLSVDVDFFTTEYVFRCEEVMLAVRFTTPLLLNELNVMARPITYVEFELLENNNMYPCKISYSVEDCLCLKRKGQADVAFHEFKLDEIVGGYLENEEAKPLQYYGDRTSIDWGKID